MALDTHSSFNYISIRALALFMNTVNADNKAPSTVLLLLTFYEKTSESYSSNEMIHHIVCINLITVIK